MPIVLQPSSKFGARTHEPLLSGGSKLTPVPRTVIDTLSEDLLARFVNLPLLSAYDMYQQLMDYWDDVMQDDVYLIAGDGWIEAAQPRGIIVDKERKWSIGMIASHLSRLYLASKYTLSQYRVIGRAVCARQTLLLVVSRDTRYGRRQSLGFLIPWLRGFGAFWESPADAAHSGHDGSPFHLLLGQSCGKKTAQSGRPRGPLYRRRLHQVLAPEVGSRQGCPGRREV